MSHSGHRTVRRRLAAYPAVNSPLIAVSTTNACSIAAGSPAGEASRIVTVAKAGHSGPRERLGMDLAELRAAA